MKKGTAQKLLSILLAFGLVTPYLTSAAYAVGVESQGRSSAITITGESEDTVTVTGQQGEDPSGPVERGSLQLYREWFTIDRDYEQTCSVSVYNPSDEPKEFYLEATNNYDDLSMGFIESGSKDNPTVIAAGEHLAVKLSVFAQNAEKEQYTIPVTAYVRDGEGFVEDAKNNVVLSCDIPTLSLDWDLVSSDESTLRKSFKVTNLGDALTDLTITTSESIADYVSFSPAVFNLALGEGESVEFEVRPDLAKMKREGVSTLSGSLIASCAGMTSEFECSFDTRGEEITITTMGSLALEQDGNPFSKFEILEETATLEYVDEEGQVRSFGEGSTIEDVLDEDGLFDMSFSSDVDLGVSEPVTLAYGMKATSVSAEEAATIDTTPVLEETDDGSVVMRMRIVLTAEEYLALLDEAIASGNEAEAIALMSARKIDPQGNVVLDTVFEGNELLTWVGSGSTAIGYIGNAYEISNMTVEAFGIAHDPDYTDSQRVGYYGASIMRGIIMGGGIAITAANPLVGTLFSILTKPLDKMLSDYQDSILENPMAERYYDVYGFQCTNRGKIEADFYAPDYGTSDGTRPSMYSSSRMYGEGYVDREETNFDIILNDQPAGSVSNTGVTDVAMAEVGTEGLRLGENNTIVFDYDTSPGHYFISTDTQITLLYPTDTEVGYIGEPDDLQDVRTKPDFCVYSENIFASDDAIVGEVTGLSFNVYNRGSSGGWFNVTCSDGENVLLQETNYYLDAFSSATFEIEGWTPSSESNEVRVELVNTSVNLEERSNDNNVAVANVVARQREVPQIKNVLHGEIMAGEPFTMMVDVIDTADVTGAVFTVDGTALAEPAVFRTAEGLRYQVSFEKGLDVGTHTLGAEFTYVTASGEQKMVLSTEFEVVPLAFFSVALPDDVTSPIFQVFHYGSEIQCDFEQTEDGSYRCAMTSEMKASPDDFTIVISGGQSVLVTTMSEGEADLSEAPRNELAFAQHEGLEISSAYISMLISPNDSYCYPSAPISVDEPVLLTPGVYEVRVEGSWDGNPISVYVEVDLTDGNLVLDVTDRVFHRSFEMLNSDASWYNTALFMRSEESEQWQNSYLNTQFDSETRVLTCSGYSEWEMEEFGRSEEAYLVVWSESEAYFVQVSGEANDAPALSLERAGNAEDATTLDKSSLNEVVFVPVSEDWAVGNVYLQWNDLAVDLYGNTIYIPDGDFSFSVTLISDVRTVTCNVGATVSESCEVPVGDSLTEFRDVTISWPAPFARLGTVQATPETGSTLYEWDFASGNAFRAPEGHNDFLLDLMCSGVHVALSRAFEVGEKDNLLQVGADFRGSVDLNVYDGGEYPTGSNISASLEDVSDEYGNAVDYLYVEADGSLQATATFVDVDDPGRTFTTAIEYVSDLNWLYLALPDEPGTYQVAIKLLMGDGAELHTVVFDSQGGSEVPSSVVESGGLVARPTDPVRSGYHFMGWYTDAACTQAYDFSSPVKADLTLYARWSQVGSGGGTVMPPAADDYPVSTPDELDGGAVSVLPERAEKGEQVTVTVEPDPGQELRSLVVTDADGDEIELTDNGDGTFEFVMPDGEVSVEAVFGCDGGDLCVTHDFPDINQDAWYHDALDWAIENDVMNGYDNGTFGPDDRLMREQAAAVMYNYLGEGDVTAPIAPHADVLQGQWYSEALNWAVANGVMNGYDGIDRFGIGESLTREQFCGVIANAVGAGLGAIDLDVLDAYPDSDDVSDWARPAVAWAVEVGVIHGVELDDGTLSLCATNDVTRAEMAAMVYNAVMEGVLSK